MSQTAPLPKLRSALADAIKERDQLRIVLADACDAMGLKPENVDSSGASEFAMLISEGVRAREDRAARSAKLETAREALRRVHHIACGGEQLEDEDAVDDTGALAWIYRFTGETLAALDFGELPITRDIRQRKVAEWCAAAFGSSHAASVPQRGIRLLEEAIEVAQSAGCAVEMCHRLVDHVFSREAGSLHQELGGVGMTLLALAEAAGLRADEEESRELARVLARPLEHFAARNKAKNDAGFNVEASEQEKR
jgi:hypothetical protein